MHRIADQWYQLKAHQLAGQMFKAEDDLAMAVLQAMDTPTESGAYSLQRFKFQST